MSLVSKSGMYATETPATLGASIPSSNASVVGRPKVGGEPGRFLQFGILPGKIEMSG